MTEHLAEQQGVHGVLMIELFDTSGAPLSVRWVNNLVTRGGKELLAHLLTGKGPLTRWTLAVGSGLDMPQAGDLALKDRIASVDTTPAVEVKDGAVRAIVRATLPAPDKERPLSEAGIEITLDGNTTLFNRVAFAVINQAPNVVLTLTWEISF